jgi:poly-gamma-glutamate capsule biosynthesis protein CapA/YwtB (metallophosphatase superfamily)
MEFNEEAGTFIAYSLGDFCSDGVRSGTEYSVILELEITKDLETEETKVTGYNFTPIYMVTENNEPLRVVQIAPAMAAFNSAYIDPVSQLSYDEMVYALDRIKARIQGS